MGYLSFGYILPKQTIIILIIIMRLTFMSKKFINVELNKMDIGCK